MLFRVKVHGLGFRVYPEDDLEDASISSAFCMGTPSARRMSLTTSEFAMRVCLKSLSTASLGESMDRNTSSVSKVT